MVGVTSRAEKRRWSTVAESPARELGSLHPEAIGAAVEETKPPEPPVSRVALGDLSAIALFPPVATLQDIMREHVAPWNKGKKNHNHEDGFDVFCCRRIDLVGGP
jgi:hypothetical protein